MNRKQLERVSRPDKKRLIKHQPGRVFDFDIPLKVVEEVKKLTEKELNTGNNLQVAEKISNIVVSTLDGMENRTAQMVDIVAKQTGIRFPHVFQKYMEFYLSTVLNPAQYVVTESTRKKINCKVNSCPSHVKDCKSFCESVLKNIAMSKNLNVSLNVEKTEGNKYCTITATTGD